MAKELVKKGHKDRALLVLKKKKHQNTLLVVIYIIMIIVFRNYLCCVAKERAEINIQNLEGMVLQIENAAMEQAWLIITTTIGLVFSMIFSFFPRILILSGSI